MKPLAAVVAFLGLALSYPMPASSAQVPNARNPLIHADVPDIAIVRVDRTYYMSSTTMHMVPGLPIMRSDDLVNWSLVSYAHQNLGEVPALRLENGKNAYGSGSWASSIRHHNGVYYVSTFSGTTGLTHIYTTRDIESGRWESSAFAPSLHDHSLWFEEDGSVYMFHGAGDIILTELNPNLSGVKAGGFDRVVIPDASLVAGPNVGLKAEGTQVFKHDGYYYVVNITWPRGGMRTAIIHRSRNLKGPYEGRILLQDQGVAQGSLIDTPDGRWFAYLFKDSGAVGRIPYLVPARWEDGWPVLGDNGKVPETLDIPAGAQGRSGISNLIVSDEFEPRSAKFLNPAWQWNHNPDPENWSLTARPGHLRLTTSRVDEQLLSARNTLTQRTFGPRSVATVKVDTGAIKDGDYAGLCVLQRRYGFVAVQRVGDERFVVMVTADTNDTPVEIARVPLESTTVRLRAECEFGTNPERASFSYSLDGEVWHPIGRPSMMTYTLPHFMGYRFGLFCYATKEAGGHADFDFCRITP